jgi:heat shock protein HslJ
MPMLNSLLRPTPGLRCAAAALLCVTAACQSVAVDQPTPGASSQIAGSQWLLARVDGTAVPERTARPMMVVFTNSHVSGTACNSFSGHYSIDGGRLVFGTLISTRMSCGEAIDAIEQRFFQVLQSSPSFRFGSEDSLLIGDSVVVELRRR